MKSFRLWIVQGLVPLAVTFGMAAAIVLVHMLIGEVDLKSIALFTMAYGMVFSYLMSSMMQFNPVYLALSMGETRKGTCQGVMMSRILHGLLMTAAGVPMVFFTEVVVNGTFPLILITYLGLQFTSEGISGLMDCLLLRYGRKLLYLDCFVCLVSVAHVALMVFVGDFPFVAGIALAEGLILTVLSGYFLKKTLNTWNVQL